MLRALLVHLGGVVAAGAIVASGGTASPAGADTPGPRSAASQPVPSLTPAATQQLWNELVQRPGMRALRTSDCRPLRVVFYSPTDWLRLVTKLAANASPCAQYYISVPPLAADKTQPRSDQAWRIRALGPAFHALAEINVTGWTSWVATTGNSWFAAGVEARRRMAAAGYDVAAGDSWALNELSSAVRQGVGNARANMRAFLHGLHDGDGVLPTTRGVVFVIGLDQSTGDLSVYQARLQDWYEDAAFWDDLSRYASDWSQELYGDVRAYAAAGAARDTRRDSLNEYLQHQGSLASVAPAPASGARTFLDAASSPLANAAWQYDASFGWTNVPVELIQDYVSAQAYAMRSAENSRFGFAWSPRNLVGLPTADFNAQTDALLLRLAAAIADSAASPEAACGSTWCIRDLAGAALTPAWRTFATWKPSVLEFTTPAQTLSPGVPSAPLTVELRSSSGTVYTAGLPVPVELSSSSPTGEFSTGPAGPWTATLAAPIASGTTAASFYFRDAQSGPATITATAAGKTAATQTVTVAAAEETVVYALGDGADGSAISQALAGYVTAQNPDRFFYLGDVYETGTAAEFASNYDALYGAMAAKTDPLLGDHEYDNRSTGYYPYWQAKRGWTQEQAKHRSYVDASGWQVIAYSSEEPDMTAEAAWVAAEVAKHPGTCRIVLGHKGRHVVVDTAHNDSVEQEPVWAAIREKTAVNLVGNNHIYGRLAPLEGVTVIVSGAGGRSLRSLGVQHHPVAASKTGVATATRLVLRPGEADFSQVDANGAVHDSGSVTCTQPDMTPPLTTITSSPADPSTQTTASFALEGSDDQTSILLLRFECRLDSQHAAAWSSCSSPRQYTGLGVGSHTFEVRAIDQAGNIDASPASFAWTIATADPPAPPPPPPPPPPSSGGGGGAAPDLLIEASAAPAAPAVGGTITYLVGVRNLAGAASRAYIHVQLPAQVVFAAAQTNRGPGCTGTTTLTCDLDFLSGDVVATVQIQAAVRAAGTLTMTATSAAVPADLQPANDTATVVTLVGSTEPAGPAPDAAPALRLVGKTPVVARRAATADVSVRFWVSEGAQLQARITPLTSSRSIALLAGTTIAGSRSTKVRTAATANVSRRGTYLARLRLQSARLVRGRSYLVLITAVDTSGQRRALTIRVRA